MVRAAGMSRATCTSNAASIVKPDTGGKSWMTMGIVSASASAAKWALTLAELSLGARGGLTITAAAPADCAARLNSRQVCRPSVVVPDDHRHPAVDLRQHGVEHQRPLALGQARGLAEHAERGEPRDARADEVFDIAPKALDVDVTALPERRGEYRIHTLHVLRPLQLGLASAARPVKSIRDLSR